MYSLSLRMIVSLVVLVMGTLGIALALYTGEEFHDVALENQRIAYEEILGLRVNDKLNSLEKIAAEMGQAVQNQKAFREELAKGDRDKVTENLNNQFHQYFITAGVLQPFSLIAYDARLKVVGLATNTSGDRRKNTIAGKQCDALVRVAKSRSGASRYKRIAMMCKQGHHPSYHILVPIGGLRIIGYLDVVTDPIHFMASIERDLGLVMAVKTDAGEIVYASRDWPNETSDAWHLLASHFQRMPNSDDVAFEVSIFRDIESYRKNLNAKRDTVLVTASILTLVLAALALLVLNRTTLKPLSMLAREINALTFDESQQAKLLPVTGNKEVRLLTENFNQLSQKLQLVYGELHQANSELRANSENLEELVEQRTADLEIARDTAIHANQSKSQFLANMSHELRTPLNAIIGYSEMMLEEAKEEADQDKIEDLSKINSAGQHLLALIKDILDLSKIEAGRMELEVTEFSLPGLIKDISNTAAPLFITNNNVLNVIFDSTAERMVNDSTKLRQAILNLLGNAAKFTENGNVELTVSDVNFNNQQFVDINVTDTGIGLSEDQKEKIFDSFSQGDLSTTRKYGGSGLGLTISRRYCQLMGGTLTVSSQLNVGSTFSIRVPLSVNTEMTDYATNAASTSGGLRTRMQPVACIVSKHPNARQLSEKLEQIGFHVCVEENLKSLKNRVQTSLLNVLLVDQSWVMEDADLQSLLQTTHILKRVAIACIGNGGNHAPNDVALNEPALCERTYHVQYDDSNDVLSAKFAALFKRFAQAPIFLISHHDNDTQSLVHALHVQGWQVQKHHSLLDARKSFLKQKASAIVMDISFYTSETAAWMDTLKFRTPNGSIPVILCGDDCKNDGRLQHVVERVDKILEPGLGCEEMAGEIDKLLWNRVA